jgi:hypothetical protein
MEATQLTGLNFEGKSIENLALGAGWIRHVDIFEYNLSSGRLRVKPYRSLTPRFHSLNTKDTFVRWRVLRLLRSRRLDAWFAIHELENLVGCAHRLRQRTKYPSDASKRIGQGLEIKEKADELPTGHVSIPDEQASVKHYRSKKGQRQKKQ